MNRPGALIELGASGRNGAASASPKVQQAAKFSGTGGIVLEIATNTAVDISRFKKNPAESEVVLLPGTRFQVLSMERKHNRFHVRLREAEGASLA